MGNKNKKLLQPVNLNYLLTILVVLTTIGSFSSGVSYTTAYREFIAEVGFIGLLLYWLYKNQWAKTIKLRISNTRMWFLGLFLLATASFFWSENIGFFLSKYLMWLGAGAVFLLALNLKVDTKTYIYISKTLVFLGVFIAILGIIQTLFSVDIFVQNFPPAANFVNKNRASQVIVLILPLAFFLLLVDRKRLSNLYPFALSLMLVYIFYAQTRAAWLGIGVAFLFLIIAFIFYIKRFKQAFSIQSLHFSSAKIQTSILAIVVLFGLVNFSAEGWSPFWQVFTQQVGSIIDTTQQSTNAVEGRYKIWQTAVLMLQQNPVFGSGMGSYYHNILTQSQNYTTLSANTHNDLLEMLVELGVVGGVLFFGVVVSLVFNLVKLMRQDNHKNSLFFLMLGIALVGSFVNMQFSFPYQMSVPLTIFALYSGLIIKACDSDEKRVKSFKIDRKYALGFVAIIFLSAVAMNAVWLDRFSTINKNFLQNKWQTTGKYLPIGCHKLIVRTLYAVSQSYGNSKNHNTALAFLNEISHCIPNHWRLENLTGMNELALKRYDLAIKSFEKAKQHHLAGFYQDYIGQYIAYINTNNLEGAKLVYQQLSKKPIELLVRSEQIVLNLIKMSIKFNDENNVIKFYKLHLKNYGENETVKTWVQSYLPNKLLP